MVSLSESVLSTLSIWGGCCLSSLCEGGTTGGRFTALADGTDVDPPVEGVDAIVGIDDPDGLLLGVDGGAS